MSDDFTEVWKQLNEGNHVLLLVDAGDDSDVLYERTESIYTWFASVVEERHGKMDFLMKNGAWLAVRRLSGSVPAYPGLSNMKVMVLRP